MANDGTLLPNGSTADGCYPIDVDKYYSPCPTGGQPRAASLLLWLLLLRLLLPCCCCLGICFWCRKKKIPGDGEAGVQPITAAQNPPPFAQPPPLSRSIMEEIGAPYPVPGERAPVAIVAYPAAIPVTAPLYPPPGSSLGV